MGLAHRPGFRQAMTLSGYFVCFLVNCTLNIVLITTMPAKKTTSSELSPLESFQHETGRNR
jgi:hypothetical protein